MAVAAVAALLAGACSDDSSSDEAGADVEDGSGDGAAGRTVFAEAPTGDEFYQPPEGDLADYEPGEVLWATELDPVDGGRAWQVLYRSESLRGDPIVVSGWIVVPDGEPQADGAPVLAWAHGTTGVADACALTKSATPSEGIPFLESFLDMGFVVTATDYEGLGTPGLHPYVIGPSEAHSVLDSIRAAQRFTGAGDEAVVFGSSQGGHAAIFANEEAVEYAPELEILGTVSSDSGVFAPDADIVSFLMTGGLKGFLVITAVGLNAAYGDEERPLSDYLTDRGIEEAAIVEEGCVREVIGHFADVPPEELWAPGAFEGPPNPESVAGTRAGVSPLLMLHGRSDEIIPAAVIPGWVDEVCALGQTVDLVWFDTAHGVPGRDPAGAEPVIMEWIEGRLAGQEPPSVCGAVPQP